ncbi:BRO family protein [Frankia sp. R43]|uniref:BRO-N domain-containing protein n=1 Tax=Frankia sp. R43 TaxID=269536 RepID=UPI0006CA008D|nr:BRO family protein [Frankia sp. R43]
MNEIVLFTYPLTGDQVRVVGSSAAPLFHLADLCRVLEHTNPTVAARMLDDDDSVMIDMRDVFAGQSALNTAESTGAALNTTARFVTEPGFYTLALSSRAAGATRFRRWVAREVLPTLRKTGRYETPTAAPALDTAETERRLRMLGIARRAGVLSLDEVREQGRELLAPFGLAPKIETLDQQRQAEVMRWIHRRYTPGQEVSLKEMYRGLDGRTWVNRTADLEPVVVQLVANGHLRRLPVPEVPKRGRPASPRFEVMTRPDRPILTVVPAGRGVAS